MKEIKSLPGDDMYDLFQRAWKAFDHEEIVTFHHNGCQIIISPDRGHWTRESKRIAKQDQR